MNRSRPGRWPAVLRSLGPCEHRGGPNRRAGFEDHRGVSGAAVVNWDGTVTLNLVRHQ